MSSASAVTMSMHEFVNTVPFELTAVLVRLGPFFAVVRNVLEITLWTRSSLDSFLTLSAWWALCLTSGLILKYFLPPVLFILFIYLSFSVPNTRSMPPSISESSLQASISDMTVIQALLPSTFSIYSYISPTSPLLQIPVLTRLTLLLYLPYLFLTYYIPLRILIALLGTFFLTYNSPHIKLIRTTLWRSSWIRWSTYHIWSTLSGIPLPKKSISYQPTSITSPEPTSSLRFLFTIYENQRWWMGLDWTAALLPGERPSWCSGSQQPALPPNAFCLPEPTTVFVRDGMTGRRVKRTATWRWEESEWKVVVSKEGGASNRVEKPLPTITAEKEQGILMKAAGKMKEANAAAAAAAASNKEGDEGTEEEKNEADEDDVATDPDGWIYADNKWEGKSAKGGMGKYTRYRRWTRVAIVSETVEIVEDGELGIQRTDRHSIDSSNSEPNLHTSHSRSSSLSHVSNLPSSPSHPNSTFSSSTLVSIPSSSSSNPSTIPFTTSPKIIPKALPGSGSVSDPIVATSSNSGGDEGGGSKDVGFATIVAAGPCDIYASGGTPCVAAHGTVRALFSAYNGALYQVTRSSDNAVTDIKPLSAGGVANAAAQDSFCSGTSCVISIIYDQSGRGNHLTRAPPGGFRGPGPNGADNLASATAAPIRVGGQKAYGVFISPGMGYRNNRASGTARGDGAQGMYAIFDGTHFNGGCCFDYGNAETSSTDTGNGHMEAIYFGNSKTWGTGSGNGPWIMADLENGLFSGQNPKQNTANPSINFRFVTAVVKGEPNQWAIRGGDSTSGSLSTFYSGVRPSVSGYNPMSKEGAIILGIGGDNSVGATGTFYEGVMTSGYPSDSTENSVQANIVAARFST
ncbi:hypothetical protein D9758_007272 [Tetrapyrgos nigripes]|uniref:Alpha-L-arabinofuranosidase n=1 Tax=Tetrapyrgos nigripes TaxID=182062 RepID=A0A8H5GBI4_9AGAR|nr:hypothetical protein D9758_007272 [Tetrapyrgos nigripes]